MPLSKCPGGPIQFVLGIKTKFKDFSGEIYKKLNSLEPGHFSPESLAKIIIKKWRDFIKRVVILTKIQSAIEASLYLTLMDNCKTFYSHFFFCFVRVTRIVAVASFQSARDVFLV